jgi:hypothetical protein
MYAPSTALFSIQLSPFKTTVFERQRDGMEFKVSDGRLAMKTELATVGLLGVYSKCHLGGMEYVHSERQWGGM